MANRTDVDATDVLGSDPQHLMSTILRTKIYETQYWLASCFGLNAEGVVDRAVDLDHIGMAYGTSLKPTDFSCLVLKMLQISPGKDVAIEFIRQEDFKYARCLGAVYLRLIGKPLEVYEYLEPLYNDYRKLRLMTMEGRYVLTHVDEFVDGLLNSDNVCGTLALPRLPKRWELEKSSALPPRTSALGDAEDIAIEEERREEGKAMTTDGADADVTGADRADTSPSADRRCPPR